MAAPKSPRAAALITYGKRALTAAVVLAGLIITQNLLFPQLNGYYQIIAMNAGIAIILAVSLNLINGITGQFSLGHAGFMAIGAYTAAYFTKVIGHQLMDPVNFALALILGSIVAGFAGLLVGLPSLRLRGDYLAIVTLGFNLIIVSIIRNMQIVGGASGYINIPKFTTFAWVFGMVILCIISIRNLADSHLGRSMRAVRDDEIAAEAAGINTTRIKVIAFVFSSMWAGVAGALQVHLQQTANPSDFGFLKSVEVVVSVVLGGLGSITGVALASGSLKVLEEVLRSVPGVFWTGTGLVALAVWWSYPRHRNAIKKNRLAVAGWLAYPALFFLCLLVLLYFPAVAKHLNDWYFTAHGKTVPPDWIEGNRGSLRYVIYSMILIVLMLLRPQGLMGRAELSFAAIRNLFRRKRAPGGQAPGGAL